MSYKIKEILPFIINRRYQLAALLAMTVGVVFFKLWYRNASASDLSFLLFPTDFLFGLVVGERSVLTGEGGYFYAALQIVIDKSCSGAHFLLLSVITILVITSSKTYSIFSLVICMLWALLGGWLYSIIVNVSRITIIYFLNQLGADAYPWLHEMIGGVIYLSMLILLYGGVTLLVSRFQCRLHSNLYS